MSTLIRNVRPVGLASDRPTEPLDLALAEGRIVAWGPQLPRQPGQTEWDGAGRWVIPGLWDAHVHFRQWSKALTHLDLSQTGSAQQVLELVRARLDQPDPPAVLTGLGYRAPTWTVQPSVAALDAVTGSHPVILFSGDLHSAWFNSAALARYGAAPRDGLVQEAELFGLTDRLTADEPQLSDQDLIAAQERAAAWGLVGLVDFEFEPTFQTWPKRYDRVGRLKIVASTYPEHLDRAIAAGLRSGQTLVQRDGQALVSMGSLKVITDGALNTRTAHCRQPYLNAADLAQPCGVQTVPAAELTELVARASAAGLQVALHAIGDAAVAIALDAVEATGASGSLEHVQLVDWADLPRMARAGLAASVQPAHLLDDQVAIERIWPDRAERCFPLAALATAGVELRLGSDAPVAPLDPWLAIAAAVHRGQATEPSWHPEQALSPAQALQASTRSTLAVGQPADLVLLGIDPLVPGLDSASAAAALRQPQVAATWVAGQLVWSDL
ncbi:MAG: amidohydrolase family protein [Propionibacteriaceae bacterium]|jgi:predicted amidohydrolase YtcJ|nr:amidohydrolase family protein [Propionibacteriaceae bacterium]